MNCFGCRVVKKIHSQSLCRCCYTKQTNRRSLDKIANEFKPVSNYNGEVFSIFNDDFDGRHIKNADLPVARRFVSYLETHPIDEITSWADAFRLSDAAKIYYTNSKAQGCPFIRIGRCLEKSGKIKPRREARVLQLKYLMNSFPNELRTVMDEFYRDIAGSHKTTSSALKILVSVKTFYQLIEKPLFEASPKDAQLFINSLSKYSNVHFTERVRSLNRFYKWAKARGLCVINPFDGGDLSHLRRSCKACNQIKVFWLSDKLCDECYKNQLFSEKHAALVSNVKCRWPYNQHLFVLYLKYLNRYHIHGSHLGATKLLITFLQEKEVKVMKSWSDVRSVQKAFMQFHDLKKITARGRPIQKIAYILQELGVLPLREEDRKIYFENALHSADQNFVKMTREYLSHLRQQRRSWQSLHATFKMIYNFYLWQEARGCPDIFITPEAVAREYLLSTKTGDSSGVLRRVLDKFYRWAIYKKKTLFNPFAGIPSVKPSQSLLICSNEVIKKLSRFIKNSKSDPESALILCLIFYFGFTAADLAMANLESDENFKITLRQRGELTYGRKVHSREQILVLPKEPSWLLSLQKRYLVFWQERYNKIERDFPLSPLILRADSRNPRHLRTLAVVNRVKIATMTAVGFEIPINVIRRTGAHVYAQQVDAAVLTQFGWSKDYSFDFVWRQRRLFTPKK